MKLTEAEMSKPRTLRVCPMRDALCPHGLDCPYVGDGPFGYPCKDGWKIDAAKAAADAFRTALEE